MVTGADGVGGLAKQGEGSGRYGLPGMNDYVTGMKGVEQGT